MNVLQRWNRRAARLVKRGLFGRDVREVDEKHRLPTYRDLMWYLNFERVSGDILEFGVCEGKSLLLLTDAYRPFRQMQPMRQIVGFDSFEGLEDDHEGHSRFTRGLCREPGANAAAVIREFSRYRLEAPRLEVGPFADTLPRLLGSKYTQAALVHVDCDLYEATREVLRHVEPILADGAAVLFDDWFCYRGDPGKGQARAFGEFLSATDDWEAVPYTSYGILARAFLMHRR
jgi:hypothetical protein